jgi:hypothetical protein
MITHLFVSAFESLFLAEKAEE